MARSLRLLSQHSREELAKNIDAPWFRELLENLRYTATFVDRTYTDKRGITELEHQALNGSFREGAAMIVERMIVLAKEPEKEQPPQEPPFGTLQQPTPDPRDPRVRFSPKVLQK